MTISEPGKYPPMYLVNLMCTVSAGGFEAGWDGPCYVGLLSDYWDMNGEHVPARYCVYPKRSPANKPMYKTFDSMDELNDYFVRT